MIRRSNFVGDASCSLETSPCVFENYVVYYGSKGFILLEGRKEGTLLMRATAMVEKTLVSMNQLHKQ